MGASSAYAITDSETNASIPFNLSAPGARSMGMGGAFLGLADDATAAYTNPAGLTQLVTPEVSAEASPHQLQHSVRERRLGDDRSLQRRERALERFGFVEHRILSFLSFVLPHDRWSFAAVSRRTGAISTATSHRPTAPSSATTSSRRFRVERAFEPEDHQLRRDRRVQGHRQRVARYRPVVLRLQDQHARSSRSEFDGNATGIPAGTPVNQQIQRGSDNASA